MGKKWTFGTKFSPDASSLNPFFLRKGNKKFKFFQCFLSEKSKLSVKKVPYFKGRLSPFSACSCTFPLVESWILEVFWCHTPFLAKFFATYFEQVLEFYPSYMLVIQTLKLGSETFWSAKFGDLIVASPFDFSFYMMTFMVLV